MRLAVDAVAIPDDTVTKNGSKIDSASLVVMVSVPVTIVTVGPLVNGMNDVATNPREVSTFKKNRVVLVTVTRLLKVRLMASLFVTSSLMVEINSRLFVTRNLM